MWPLPVILLAWIGLYIDGLEHRNVTPEDAGIVLGAGVFFAAWMYLVARIASSSFAELARVTFSEPENRTRP